ncbi:MAG: ImmA/IrrE family metallo-endopeptidase [Dehalococcoidia bacterium]
MTAVQIDSETIREAVNRLLDAARVSEPPVDLVQLAKLQGINSIRHRKMKRTLGMVKEGQDGSLTMLLNSRQPLRERFTMAHEIAHTIVDRMGDKPATVVLAARTPRRGTALERLCDQIAAELLMPYEMFTQSMQGEGVSLNTVERLARTYEASLQSTALRMGELSDAPAQVVCWEREQKLGLRVRWKSGQPLLTAKGATAYRSLSNETSPIARAYASKQRETGHETPWPDQPWCVYHCEAKGFLRGSARFVLSVVRPATLN